MWSQHSISIIDSDHCLATSQTRDWERGWDRQGAKGGERGWDRLRYRERGGGMRRWMGRYISRYLSSSTSPSLSIILSLSLLPLLALSLPLAAPLSLSLLSTVRPRKRYKQWESERERGAPFGKNKTKTITFKCGSVLLISVHEIRTQKTICLVRWKKQNDNRIQVDTSASPFFDHGHREATQNASFLFMRAFLFQESEAVTEQKCFTIVLQVGTRESWDWPHHSWISISASFSRARGRERVELEVDRLLRRLLVLGCPPWLGLTASFLPPVTLQRLQNSRLHDVQASSFQSNLKTSEATSQFIHWNQFKQIILVFVRVL